MHEIVRIALAVLSAHRIVELFLYDDGPLGVFDKLRNLAGANQGDDWEKLPELGKLLSCPYCFSVWAALFCAILVTFRRRASDFALIWLGIAGAQSIIVGKRSQ